MLQPGALWTPLVPPSEGPQVRTRVAPPLRFALRVLNAAFVVVGFSAIAFAFHNRRGCSSGGGGGGGGSSPSLVEPSWAFETLRNDAAVGGRVQDTHGAVNVISGIDAVADLSTVATTPTPSTPSTPSISSLRRALRGSAGDAGASEEGLPSSSRSSSSSILPDRPFGVEPGSRAAASGFGASLPSAVPQPHRWWFLWCAFGAGTYLAALGGIGFGSLRLSQLRSLSTYVALCSAAAAAAVAAGVWDETGRRPPPPPDATGCLAELESWAAAHPDVARRLATGALAALLAALGCGAALRAAHGAALRSWIEATSDATARTRDLLVGTARSALDGRPGSVWSGAVRDRYAIDAAQCASVDASARALWPLLQHDGSNNIFSTEAY